MASSIDDLIKLYLEHHERGQKPQVEELLAQAGEHRVELEKWIRSHQAVQAVKKALDPKEQPSSQPPEEGFRQYTDLRVLGVGGMATVYKAWDKRLERTVALKFMKSGKMPSADAWLHEARTLAHLDHPNVVRVHEADVYEERPYLSMEFIDGWDLEHVLNAMASDIDETDASLSKLAAELQPFEARLELARQIAAALESCHEIGTLHRDLKPLNILVTPEGVPKLLDFGLAHHDTHTDLVGELSSKLYGTPRYMAPEQMTSGQTGGNVRTDLYALGLVFYEIFALKKPVRTIARGTPEGEIAFDRPPPIKKVPDQLNSLIGVCLRNEPDDRYASAAAIRKDLGRIRDHRPIRGKPPSLLHRARLWTRRQPRAAGAIRLAVLLALAYLAWDFWDYRGDRADLVEEINAAYAFSEDPFDKEFFEEVIAKIQLEPSIYIGQKLNSLIAANPSRGADIGSVVEEIESGPRSERGESLWYFDNRPQTMTQDRADLQVAIDKVAGSLDELEQLIPRAHEASSSFWRVLSGEQPTAVFERGLRELADELSELVQYEEIHARREDWTTTILFPLVTRINELGEQLVGEEPLEDIFGLAGSVSLQPTDGEYVVYVQKWYPEDPRIGVQNPLSHLSSPYAIVDPYSGLQLTTPLFGRLFPEQFYRFTFVRNDNPADFFEVNYRTSVRTGRDELKFVRQPWVPELYVTVPAGSIELVVNKFAEDGTKVFDVPGFQIDKDLVTWGELGEFAEAMPDRITDFETYLEMAENPVASGRPCAVPWSVAAAYAQWRGARLPTMLEIARLQEHATGHATLPKVMSSEGLNDASGEWIEDWDPHLRMGAFFRYAPAFWPGKTLSPEYAGRFAVLFSTQNKDVGFRCARSLEPPVSR